ncbi:hypothetical protein NCC49_004493 [Naganishia albida]|nr:hypothetical protein NCC49_004493 [Naganishia albida]
MGAYNITIDDTSPLITYTGTWIRKHPEDTKIGQYFSKNFAKTRTVGDRAELRFNGTGIWAYGSRRESHGTFKATLDGAEVLLNGYLQAPGVIQDVLFSQTGLDAHAEHTLTLTNTEARWFDVDYYIVQHEETSAQELDLVTLVVDAPSPDYFTYTGDWNFKYAGVEYHNRTSAMSYASGDTVEFSFTGTSVAVYGAVNMNHGDYRVTFDGIAAEYSGYYDAGLTGQTVMFHRAGLENATHTVAMTNLGEKPVNFWGLDYVVVNYTVPSEANGHGEAQVVSVGSQTIGSSGSIAASRTPTVKPTTSSISTSVAANMPPIATQTSDTSTTSSSSALPGSTDSAILGGSNSNASRSDNSLSNGALAGVIIASVTTVAALILVVWFLIRRRSKNKEVTAYP